MRRFRGIYHWLVRSVLLLAVGVFWVGSAGRTAVRESAALPRDPQTGIMRVAEPLRIDRGRAGACLLLHGWISTPADFGNLPQALDGAGWDVYAPLHPGHGTTPADLDGLTAEELLHAARAHHAELRARYEKVVLIGFSMGGTMATILAGEQLPDKLVLVAPFYGVTYRWYFVLPPRWWGALLSPFVRYVKRSERLTRVNRPGARGEILAYGAFPVSAVRALFALRRRAVRGTDLSGLRMPVLLVYSSGDEASSPSAMEEFFDRLPARVKRKAAFVRSNHHILHDYDADEAARAITSFLGAP